MNFLLRNWQAVLGCLAVAILATMLVIRTGQRDDARAQAQAEYQARIAFAAKVEATSQRIIAEAQARNLRIEREQSRISQEVSDDYRERIADLNRRAAAMRVQLAQDRARPGGGGDAMPGLPDPAGRADAASPDHGLSLEQRVVATEQAIRLDELQRWLRRQIEARE